MSHYFFLQTNNLLQPFLSSVDLEGGSHLLMTLTLDKLIVNMHHILSRDKDSENKQYIGSHTMANNYSLDPKTTTTTTSLDKLDNYILSLENEISKVIDTITTLEEHKMSNTKALSITVYSSQVNKTATLDLNKQIEPTTDTELNNFESYKFDLTTLEPGGIPQYGKSYAVNTSVYPVLTSFTTYYLEIYNDCMRTMHFHNTTELGYVVSGVVLVYLWEEKTNSFARIKVTQGNMWFIPQGVMHCIINVGDIPSVLYIGFDNAEPSDLDISVLLNGLPQYVKNELAASPHSLLIDFLGPNSNYFYSPNPETLPDFPLYETSPYLFDLQNSVPSFYDKTLGKILQANSNNWLELNNTNMSFIESTLMPRTSSQPFWYSNADTLYIVAKGNADIFMSISGYDNNNNKISLTTLNYFFVPTATSHVFRNPSETDELVLLAFYSKNIPQSVSLDNSLLFYGNTLIQSNMINKDLQPVTPNGLETIRLTKAPLFKY